MTKWKAQISVLMLASRDTGLSNDRIFFVDFHLIKFRVRAKGYELIASKINGCKITFHFVFISF